MGDIFLLLPFLLPSLPEPSEWNSPVLTPASMAVAAGMHEWFPLQQPQHVSQGTPTLDFAHGSPSPLTLPLLPPKLLTWAATWPQLLGISRVQC